jgi:hypothetical protein
MPPKAPWLVHTWDYKVSIAPWLPCVCCQGYVFTMMLPRNGYLHNNSVVQIFQFMDLKTSCHSSIERIPSDSQFLFSWIYTARKWLTDCNHMSDCKLYVQFYICMYINIFYVANSLYMYNFSRYIILEFPTNCKAAQTEGLDASAI